MPVRSTGSGFGDHLPLPPLKSFDLPNLFPDQPPHVQPMREVDRKWTWSSGLSLTHPKYRLRALYQPQTANPGAFDGEQYAWRTGYWVLGGARSFGPFELLAQGLQLGHIHLFDIAEMRDAALGVLHLLRDLAAKANDLHRLDAVALSKRRATCATCADGGNGSVHFLVKTATNAEFIAINVPNSFASTASGIILRSWAVVIE